MNGMNYACPGCGEERLVTPAQLVGTWPVRCRRCKGDLFPPPPVKEVEVGEDLARCAKPRRRYPQRCYEEAMKFVVSHVPAHEGDAPVRLVHGSVDSGIRGIRAGHAWVEIGDGVVFDGVYQRFYDRASYYDVRRAAVHTAYDPWEAAGRVVAARHYGPWHDEVGAEEH